MTKTKWVIIIVFLFLLILFFTVWIFNHVNPWLAFAFGVGGFLYLISLLNQKLD
jgi:hypothetical protein